MGNPPHVLIIDDDAWTRYALAALLQRRGMTVKTAATVGEGLDGLDEHPDCVILDLGLPDGSGEAVLRRVREEGMATRVIVCTVITDERRLEGLLRLKPDAILTKPVEVRDILSVCEL